MEMRKRLGISRILDLLFFCDLVVLESIYYRTRAKQLINEGNTTGGLRKKWIGKARDRV